jgi:hypothetical protein
MPLVEAQHHARTLVSEMIDEAVVEPAKAGARIERHIGSVKGAQSFGNGVASDEGSDRWCRDRTFDRWNARALPSKTGGRLKVAFRNGSRLRQSP